MLNSRRLSIAVLATVLAACATDHSEPAPSLAGVKPCPPLVEYTAEERTRAAADIDALPAGSPVRQMIDDYHAVRDACR
jgi:hypothetical protein